MLNCQWRYFGENWAWPISWRRSCTRSPPRATRRSRRRRCLSGSTSAKSSTPSSAARSAMLSIRRRRSANNTLRAVRWRTARSPDPRTQRATGSSAPTPVDGVFKPDIHPRGQGARRRDRRRGAGPHHPRGDATSRTPPGEIVRVLERATRTFVGTYFERDGEALVRVDGTVFAHSVSVGDPGAKGAKPQDKVVIEMLRFPTPDDRGEGVIAEVLGPHGKPGVDTLSVIKALRAAGGVPGGGAGRGPAGGRAFSRGRPRRPRGLHERTGRHHRPDGRQATSTTR